MKVAFSLQKNEWQGMVSPQLMIQDIEPIIEEPIQLSAEVYVKYIQLYASH